MAIGLTPADLELPKKFKNWRGDQEDVIEKIVLSGKNLYLLDAPTGSGKSIIGVASSLIWRTNWAITRTLSGEELKSPLPRRVIYVTRTKQLQDQLLADFKNARTIKGRSNFPCLMAPDRFPELSAEDCPKSACLNKELCPYIIAKHEALSADIAVLNESYYMTEANGPGQFSQADFVILDEIDSIESTLMNNVSMNISLSTLEEFGIDPPADWDDWRNWLEWWNHTQSKRLMVAVQAEQQVQNQPAFDEWTDREIRVGKRAKRLENFNLGLTNFMTETLNQLLTDNPEAISKFPIQEAAKITISGKETPFVIQEGRDKKGYVNRFELKPVTVRNFTKKRLWRHAERFLGMSGTILSPVVLARELGLKEEQYDYRQIPSPFAVVNRPIYFWPVANMRKQNIDSGHALTSLLDAVDQIMNKYPEDKMLIHAVSYQIASAIKRDQENKGCERIITHDSDNRTEQLENFKKAKEPLVMISPSFDRGVDLPGDECRCTIVCKVPYLNLGDKQVAARLKAPGGDQWYVFKAIQTLMQMSGRGVRTETDHCDTYILDQQFTSLLARTRQYVPKWWLDAIRRIETI